MKETFLVRMTWPEAQEALAEKRVVVVPTGSIEQHGPHMPVGTDYLASAAIANGIGERSKSVIVTPAIPVGFADYHRDFPGTLSVSANTLNAYYTELVSNLVQHGADHILFVNSHGGNSATIDDVCYKLRRQGVVAAEIVWWNILSTLTPENSPAGHGDWIETALMLATNPTAVKMDKAKVPRVNDTNVPSLSLQSPHIVRFRGVPVRVRLKTNDFAPDGHMPEAELSPTADITIPPTAGTPELGKKLMDVVVGFIVDFVEEFKKLELR